ncbi:MAG: nucleotidyltransferase/DNA polymerase protein [Parcubacteria group bacterium]|nr:nucleotidyltransferase/DNA polymerase protein [Parcubacteria group bacterium]
MAWGSIRSYPRAILHVDGDSFFVSCEVAKNPSLKGKPVITGKERGIVSAASYEAKARGVKRGMRLFEVRQICPNAVILPSDYETYSLFSERMYRIVRRYTPAVEEYSIDECFADLTGLRGKLHLSYEQIAQRIKHDLDTELGMTFSIGVSATKTLAKIGSKWKKPSGLTMIPLRDKPVFLEKTPVGAVWGVGPNTAALLNTWGVRTALDFAKKPEAWVKERVSKPYFETWQELNGVVSNELDVDGRKGYKSISKTKTFTPPSTSPTFVYAQLSKNIENACIKARRWDLVSPVIYFYILTQDFRYHSYEIKLPYPTNVPQDILKEVSKYFATLFKKNTEYRATGIILAKLSDGKTVQLDLFGSVQKSEAIKRVFESVDTMSEKFGKHTIFLGSSFEAMTHSAHLGDRGDVTNRVVSLFKGETKRRRLGIPMLGEVR